jgi:CheY-like chemotaxis protein
MSQQAKILVVDDDNFMRDVFEQTLSGEYSVIPAENGVDALMLAQVERPEVILLDVGMPGMDGYELCRRLKELESTADVPVIFVSAHDRIEERLKGYEAGGEDYVTKPFDPQELKAKVAQRLKTVAERASLKQLASYASSTAMTAMTSMSEMGVVLEAMRNFSACADYRSLADALLAGLAPYGLQGTVQIRFPGDALTRSGQGEATPLEISVINHMADMGRIINFKTRMSITYPHVSLLINNMPVDDADRCGRLRDHLAMLVEGAEMKVTGIIAENESARRGTGIGHAIASIIKMLADIDSAQRQSKASTAMAIGEFTGDMEKAYVRVALSDAHEKFMAGVVQGGIEKITQAQLAEVDIQDRLSGIVMELKAITG